MGSISAENGFDLEKYLTRGVESVVRDAIRATLKDACAFPERIGNVV